MMQIHKIAWMAGIIILSIALASIHATPRGSPIHVPRLAPAASLQGAFTYVADFEYVGKPLSYYGVEPITGAAPAIVQEPSYWGGEPSLESIASSTPQIDIIKPGLVVAGGDQFISFQVAINYGSGSGFFGLVNRSYAPVAVVGGVSNGYVWAGPNLTDLRPIESLSNLTDSLYPPGWVLLMVNVYDAASPSNKSAGWVMQVFVDGTYMPPAEVAVPQAGNYYTAAIITTNGTAYYSNVVVTSLEIPTYLQKYNNMEGYGQGSGLLASLLPPFYNLTTLVLLRHWESPQAASSASR